MTAESSFGEGGSWMWRPPFQGRPQPGGPSKRVPGSIGPHGIKRCAMFASVESEMPLRSAGATVIPWG